MLDLPIYNIQKSLKMVKNKRDFKSPRRNRSFSGCRPGARLKQCVSSSRAGGNIKVVIRMRPMNTRENTSTHRNVIKIVDKNTLIFDPKEDDELFFYHGVQQKNRDIMKKANKNINFTFDHVFGDDANNELVFQSSTKSLIDTLMKGYNCSVFVYGATGAGKTHTMLGHEDEPGITFLTLMELFKQKDSLQSERDFELAMTYLEVYNETVQDLLNPGSSLSLREDSKYGVVVAGCKLQRIEHCDTLFELLDQGNQNRTQHPTDANAESSRSHAVFQVYLRMKFKTTNEIRLAKLSMIDLAGSERGAATGCTGARFTEGANINKSLLALGNCINNLADGLRHIPYRDSKLTRLLKDSLGGNCQTVMIANISPSSYNYEDTYNTLKYAVRAKKIKATIKKNVVTTEANMHHYIQLVDQLTKENEELKLKNALLEKVQPKGVSTEESTLLERQKELQTFYKEKKQLEQRILQLESIKNLMMFRKQLKNETNQRLSSICSDNSEKTQSRARLEDAVERLNRQKLTIEDDITSVKNHSETLEIEINQLLENNPNLKQTADIENAQLQCIRATNKADHLQKVCDLQSGELRMRDQLIEGLSQALKPCFLQLRGHGLATEALTAKYHDLIKHLRGIRTVSFEDGGAEIDPAITVENNCDLEGKLQFSELDNTFVVSKTKSTTYTENLKTKVFEVPPGDTISESVTNKSYVITPASEQKLEDEVFLETSTKQPNLQTQNVCAQGLMFRVSKPQESKVLFSYNQNKTVTAKRLLTKVSKSPSGFPISRASPNIHKENIKPYNRPGLNIHSTKHPGKLLFESNFNRKSIFTDNAKLKPSSSQPTVVSSVYRVNSKT